MTVAGGQSPLLVALVMVLMVAPAAPHLAEELWHRLGHDEFADGVLVATGGVASTVFGLGLVAFACAMRRLEQALIK